MKITAVIMAGGRGERFWPKSRINMPKQFLSLTSDGETMIQKTVHRLDHFVDIDDIYVVTNESYLDLVKQQLERLPSENVLLEPVARNTAPCIGLAAEMIRKKYGDAIMLVLPSDHLIKFNQRFVDALKLAASVAEECENLVTIGITPSYPETGYGYIHFGDSSKGMSGVYDVKQFVEKPDIELAKKYVSSGEYLWNSGIFVWKASSIDKNLRRYLPDMADGLDRLYETSGTSAFMEAIKDVFPKFQSESIDFGVMEKAESVYTITGNFGWDDVGNWLALERVNTTNEYGNMIQGDVISIDTNNTIICGGKKLIATVGIENIIIVDTDDVLLICSKDSTQDIKKVIENLKICNRNEFV